MIKRLATALLAVVITLLITIPVLAAYYIDIDVTESNGTDYDMLALNMTMDIDYLVEYGFISDDGLDVRIEDSQSNEVPFMLAEDRVVFASDITADMVNSFQMTTGNTPMDNFSVCVGDGGYVTVSDHANLEISNDFELEFTDVYVDTSSSNSDPCYPTVETTATSEENSATNSHTVDLPSGIQSGDLLLVVFSTFDSAVHTMTWPPTDWTDLDSSSGSVTRHTCTAYRVADGGEGASITVSTSGTVWSAHQTFRISGYTGTPEASRDNSYPGGTNPDPPSLSPSWGAALTLWIAGFGGTDTTTTAVSSYPSNYSNGAYAEGGVGSYWASVGTARRLCYASSENPGTYTMSDSIDSMAFTIAVQGQVPSTDVIESKAGSFYIYPNSGALSAGIIDSTTTKVVSATGVSSGEIDFSVWADTSDFGIDIDGSTEDSTALGGVSAADRSTDLVIANVPYYDSYTHMTSSTLRIDYSPDSIISGTTLPNEEAPGTYDGTITWGSNPAGIDISYSALQVEEAYYFEEIEPGSQDIMQPETAEMFTDVDLERLERNPLHPLVEAMADSTQLNERLVWLGGAWFILIAVFAAVLILSQANIILTCAVGLGLSSLFYAIGIFDWWVILIFGLGLLGGIVHEKMPFWG